MDEIALILDSDTQLVTVNDPSPTISVQWDQAVQKAVINTAPGPTIASRAYSMVHTAMYDAWAAYESIPVSTQLGDELQRPESENTQANKEQAMSYAAYRVLVNLFPSEETIFNELMAQLGLDPNNTTTDTTTPAGIGNVFAAALLEFRHNDGSNQLGDDPNGNGSVYSDISSYEPVNDPGNPAFIELWTPELVPIDAQPGQEDRIQSFLTPHWGDVISFSLESGDEFRPEAPEPFLLVDGEVNLQAGTITLAEDGSVVNISQEIIGTIINPEFIAQAEEVVEISANLTDEQKLIAEFWEDPGGTSFPPGTWMTFGEFVSARDDHTLDEDVQMFFALGNAVFDAGIATWEAKRFYNYTRPVRLIRELGKLGLIGEFNQSLGGYAIQAWAGPGLGTQTILATDFLTYQTPGGDPSPPFAEYVSGHSTFSSAGAEVLRLFTDSDEFGASVTFEPGESRFEPGVTPQQTVTLDWETFSEAGDEGGVSRLYGGIHFEDGDINGRFLGQEVGLSVFEQAQFYLTGGDINPVLDTANNGIFSLDGVVATNLLFKINSIESDQVNEIGVFTVDDQNGNIGNLAPDSDGYLAAALGRSQTIFSAIANSPNGFNYSEINRVIGGFEPDTNLAFYLVANGTKEQVLADLSATEETNLDVFFSTSSNIEISDLDEDGFNLAWEDEVGGNQFNDLVVNVDNTVESVTLGTELQENGQGELIDLRDEVGSLAVSVSVYREAAFDNLVGLYRVADENGAVVDPDTDELINPTSENRQRYIEAALANRVEGLDMSVSNQETIVFEDELLGGSIYAPFIIADGNLDNLEDDFENVYLPFLSVNSDQVDHIRILGANIFGFEDLAGGGDQDFNDMILEVKFV
ncbi:MAG: DUF4114 domain-containing protein [Symploca sp. SIO2E9]|nr:DUF4114 domain-containing protein [Symploca sp. SIO2E9]